MNDSERQDSSRDIAVVGLACRFPGAKNAEEYWANLVGAVESISRLSDDELRAAGVSEQLINHASYVKASGFIAGPDLFDAEFFGFNAREAEVTDPQHRVFLECAWEALENAGYGTGFNGPVAVFGGSSMNSYYLQNVLTNPEAAAAAGGYQVFIGNDKDFVPTRVSYKLNLKGPSFTVQTACSTSLVAVQIACQSLLTYQSDLALAGGVSLFFPQRTGYFYQEGMILSPDGHCRAFDAKGQGTLGGQGVGIVVLKRLQEALRDGDTIHAVIKGSAINNDGSAKVGFTAPSVDGQAEVIAMAQAMAGVEPTSISYVEAHGTATPLGDPVEIAALTQVFRASTDAKGFCAIGSVKTNIGHLDAAAGVAGLIKTVLALENRVIPASLHFEKPNPQIDFENSPFFVNSRTSEWKTKHGSPRRAGVSSFGIGGTNAHVILEEAPPQSGPVTSRPYSLLVLSARSEQALDQATDNLAAHLEQHPETELADAAYTLQVGRKVFPYRRSLVVSDKAAAIAALKDGAAATHEERSDQAVVFMFSGQGSQYPGMAAELYRHESSFSADVDRCAKALEPLVDRDLRELIFSADATGDGDRSSARSAELNETRLAQPALFVVEYALANLWIRWGVRPHAMIGHSIGEYAAATLAGVLSLEDALATVALRGRLMQQLPPGSMLAVPLAAEALANRLDEGVALAAVNGPAFCTVSGETRAIEAFESKLAAEGVECRRLHTSHAFHSSMMDPVLEPFANHMRRVRLNAPRIRYISNVSGTWIKPEEATDPLYWVRHLRGTVRFAEGLRQLRDESNRVFLEVGPGNVLSTFARQSAGPSRGTQIHASLPHATEKVSDVEFSLKTLGRLWQCGVPVDWAALHSEEKLRRVPLPSYSFERKRYFLDPKQSATVVPKADVGKLKNVADWLYLPSWKRSELLSSAPTEALHWLFLADERGLSQQIAQSLISAGHQVTHVRAGSVFEIGSNGDYTLDPFRREDYAALFSELARRGKLPARIVSFFNVTAEGSDWDSWRNDASGDYPGFASLLALGQALASERGIEAASLFLVSNHMQAVMGDEPTVPLKSLVLGLCRVIPQECPQVQCRSIDVPTDGPAPPALTRRIVQELCSDQHEPTVAYRGNARWVQTYEPIKHAAPSSLPTASWIKEGGAYLITGGLGSVGLLFAEHLARRGRARLVLTGRGGLPERPEWTAWLDRHDANDDPTAKRIKRILAMEELGAEVMVCSADVSEREQMRSVLQGAARRFGRIDGVIHAAGFTSGSFLMDTGRPQYDAHFSAKVRGVQVIEELFEGERLDFCLLVSSLSSVLGGLGFGAYSAANFFLDAIAQKRGQQTGTRWRSINWDGWDFVGGNTRNSGVGASILALAMTPEESLVALDLIQSMSGPDQIVVSTGDLESRLAQWVAREQVAGVDTGSAADASTHHARPQLQSEYATPRNDTEQQIVKIWVQLLGIDQIGIHDNFFELGGHSLLGTRVLARLQETFGVKLPLRTIFDAPTPAELAERVQAIVWANNEVPAEQTAVGDLEELEF